MCPVRGFRSCTHDGRLVRNWHWGFDIDPMHNDIDEILWCIWVFFTWRGRLSVGRVRSNIPKDYDYDRPEPDLPTAKFPNPFKELVYRIIRQLRVHIFQRFFE